jgi:alpha-L-fucosidase
MRGYFLRGVRVAVIAIVCLAGTAEADPTTATDQAVRQWQDMRFGMFIHWGPVSLKGTEIGWSRGKDVPNDVYDKLYERFNPTLFDANAWVSVAKAAGMKYLVITSKHHDGFCLWPSQYTDYHIGNTPFKRDVLRELSDACRQQGILFCTYHSVCDWYHPDYPLGSPGGRTQKQGHNMPRYYQYLKDQTRELIENYGPLGIMWFDGEWETPWTTEYGDGLYDYLKELQPSLIINNRVSKGRQGMAGTTKQSEHNPGDYDTPEQRVGGFNRERPWETCMTICQQWAWKPNDRMKSTQACIQTLLQTVGGDGNLLFNVGPMPDGRIEPRQVERLEEMGAWLRAHGQGVYGTRGGPFKPGKWGASTFRGDKIYLYVMTWPAQGPLELPAIDATIKTARVQGGRRLEVTSRDGQLMLDVPVAERDEIATVIELTVAGQAAEIEPVDVVRHSGSLTFGKKVTASNVFMNMDSYGPDKAADDNPETRWATDSGTQAAWLEVDLGRMTAVNRAVIEEPEAYQRIENFELQYHDGQAWQTCHRGTTVGPNRSITLSPITVQRIRLNILRAKDGPTICAFDLFGPDKK